MEWWEAVLLGSGGWIVILHVEWGKGANRLLRCNFGINTIRWRHIGGLGRAYYLTDLRDGSKTCLIETARWGLVDLYFEAHDLGWHMSLHRFDRLARTKPILPPWQHEEDATAGFSVDPAEAVRARQGILALEIAFEALTEEREVAAFNHPPVLA